MHADPSGQSAALLSRMMDAYPLALEKVHKTKLIITDNQTAYLHSINIQNSIQIPLPHSPKNPSSCLLEMKSPIIDSLDEDKTHAKVISSKSAVNNSKSEAVSKSLCYILIERISENLALHMSSDSITKIAKFHFMVQPIFSLILK